MQCYNVNTDAYSQKKENYRKEKPSDLFLVIAYQTLPKQHQKSLFSNCDALRREQCTSIVIALIINYRFHSGESPHSQNNTFNKPLPDTAN
jgi:hypothetical protein